LTPGAPLGSGVWERRIGRKKRGEGRGTFDPFWPIRFTIRRRGTFERGKKNEGPGGPHNADDVPRPRLKREWATGKRGGIGKASAGPEHHRKKEA